MSGEGAHTATNTKRILVVDDEPGVRRLLSDLFAGEGYLVCEAADGARALEHLAVFRPDVVVLDLTMPVMSGFKFAEECLRLDGSRELPIIAVTAEDTRTAKAQLDGLGVRVCLAKPFDIDELLSLVAQFA
jgi:CheY-like chemotaxis protein